MFFTQSGLVLVTVLAIQMAPKQVRKKNCGGSVRLCRHCSSRRKGDPQYGHHILAAPVPQLCHHEMGEVGRERVVRGPGKLSRCDYGINLAAAQGAARVDSEPVLETIWHSWSFYH